MTARADAVFLSDRDTTTVPAARDRPDVGDRRCRGPGVEPPFFPPIDGIEFACLAPT